MPIIKSPTIKKNDFFILSYSLLSGFSNTATTVVEANHRPVCID